MRASQVVLSLIGVLGLVFGAWLFLGVAKNAVHEIEGLIVILIGTVGVGSAAVVGAVGRVTAHVERGFAEAALARRDRAAGG